MNLKSFTAHLTEERILFASNSGSLAHDALSADILRIYPIGQSSPALENAFWVFSPDGFVATRIELPHAQLPQAVFLVGEWGRHGDIEQAHLAGEGQHGLSMTLDGVLRPAQPGYMFDGILCVSVRGAHHIEHVVLDLSKPSSAPVDQRTAVAIETARYLKSAAPDTDGNSKLLSEPSEMVGGVPVPSEFDVVLKVKLDGVDAGAMKGKLLINKENSLKDSQLTLTLATSGEVVPGWSGWITAPSSDSETSEGNVQAPGVVVSARDGSLRVDISHASQMRNLSWWIRSPSNPDQTEFVTVDHGAIDVRIKDDTITGTIHAQGYLSGNIMANTFTAELVGEQAGMKLAKEVAGVAGPRSFHGRWLSSGGETWNLTETASEVSGTLGKDESLSGVSQGKVLEFSWRGAGGSTGRGFLSAASSGVLVGMKWSNKDSSSAEPVYAVTAASQGAKSALAGEWLRDPQSDAEARNLKELAFDLSSAGKHQQAAEMLLKVATYFKQRNERNKLHPSECLSCLTDEAFVLPFLMQDALRASDYKILVQAASYAVDVQAQMQHAPARNFQIAAEPLIKRFKEEADQLADLADSLNRAQTSLSAGGIGVGLKDTPGKHGVKISAVAPDMPAGKAGISVDDTIISADGVVLEGMDVDQVIARLRGPAGSSVVLHIQHEGQTRELSLVRTPLVKMDEQYRQQTAVHIMEVRDILSKNSQNTADLVKTLQQLLSDSADSAAAFAKLIAILSERQTVMHQLRTPVAGLIQSCLSYSPDAHLLFERFISMQKDFDSTGKVDFDRLSQLDREMDQFEARADVPAFDKDLLKTSVMLQTAIQEAGLNVDGALRNTKFASTMHDSTAPDSAATAAALDSIAKQLEKARSMLVSDSAKIEATDLGQNFYSEYVRLLLNLNLPVLALQASEAGRARAFADLLASARIFGPPQAARSAGPDASGKTEPISTISAAQLSVDEIRNTAIHHNTTFVEYWKDGNTLYTWAVSAKGEILALPPQDFTGGDAQIYELKELIESGLADPAPRSRAAVLLQQLYEKLIAGLESRKLLPADPAQAVTFIPHGDLFLVPFAALRNAAGEYLIEQHTITYETSISVAAQARQQFVDSLPARPRLVALVGPSPLPDPTLPDLKVTRNEFPTIARLYGHNWDQEIFSAGNATFKSLMDHAPQADVLYFATHGHLSDDPSQSYIALASTSTQDGRLRVADVYQMKLRANLVILAACETGAGQVTGDGVNGLSRAFTFAGSPNLITSLWKIPEEQTIELMGWFHHYWLQEGKSKAQALREAQLQRLNVVKNQPNVWAGTVYYGLDDAKH
jgi:hypothetical protein